MSLRDLVAVSFRQVIRNRRRFQGVFLAIVLGVAGIITILTMSREIKKNINEDLDFIGGVTVIRVFFDNNRNPSNRPQWFQENTVAALGRLPGVKELSLAKAHGGQAIRHGKQYNLLLMAVDHPFWHVLSLSSLSGRLFGADAVTGRKRECVLGEKLAAKIFGTTQVTGQTLEINQETYVITGVLKSIVTDSGLDYAAFLPLTTAQDRIPGLLFPDRLYLRCRTWDDVPQVATVIPNTIETYNNSQEFLIHVYVAWEVLTRVWRLAWWVEFLAYLAVGLTFVLGGAGIWNVMMAAVTSRTREIGLKKAIGAEDRDILAQFLVEALSISLIGALVGAALGRFAMEVLSHFIGTRPPETLFLLGLSLGFLLSVILGIGAGLYPSIKASHMEVVSAIRYE